MADCRSELAMYNWHYGVQPRATGLRYRPAQACLLKDFLVCLDASRENLYIYCRRTLQLESQIGTGISDLPVFLHSVSEQQANLLVLVSDSLVQMLNMDNVHMESVNNIFEFTFVDIRSRELSIASLWTEKQTTSRLVLWVTFADSPLMYELHDDARPKIVFDRLEWVAPDRLLLARAASIPVTFSVFSLSAHAFVNHVVMGCDRGPQHFAISAGCRRLLLCQGSSFCLYDTASLKRLLMCDADCPEPLDFMTLFDNNFMAAGQLQQRRIVRYFVNEEHCSVDRVNEAHVNFENYDAFQSATAIGDELLLLRSRTRDNRSAALALVNHFDGNVFQFVKLRHGDCLLAAANCLATYAEPPSGSGGHWQLLLYDFTDEATPADLWPRLRQKLRDSGRRKKSLGQYATAKAAHVQQAMRAKTQELNRRHLIELKRIAKTPIAVPRVPPKLPVAVLDSGTRQTQQKQSKQARVADGGGGFHSQRESLLQLHAIWRKYCQRNGADSIAEKATVKQQQQQQQQQHCRLPVVVSQEAPRKAQRRRQPATGLGGGPAVQRGAS